MENIQAYLWNKLTDIADTDLHRCETVRSLELELLYDDMCRKFEQTLTRKQKEAFRRVLDIAGSVKWDNQNMGIALGLNIAKEMHRFMSCPIEAFQQASINYPPVAKSERFNTHGLDEYFNELKYEGGATQ